MDHSVRGGRQCADERPLTIAEGLGIEWFAGADDSRSIGSLRRAVRRTRPVDPARCRGPAVPHRAMPRLYPCRSSELVLAEVPRAIRRSAAQDPRLALDIMMARAGETLDAIGLCTLDRALPLSAGALARARAPRIGRDPCRISRRPLAARRFRELRRAPGRCCPTFRHADPVAWRLTTVPPGRLRN